MSGPNPIKRQSPAGSSLPPAETTDTSVEDRSVATVAEPGAATPPRARGAGSTRGGAGDDAYAAGSAPPASLTGGARGMTLGTTLGQIAADAPRAQGVTPRQGWRWADGRTPTRIDVPLRGVLTNSRANTEAGIAANRAFGLGLDVLHAALPSSISDSPYYRAAEVGLDAGLVWGTATYSHEGGHYRVAAREGLHPSIDFFWVGGRTWYTQAPRPAVDVEIAAAGINAAEETASGYYTHLSQDTGSYHDAVGFVMNNLQGSAYLTRSLARGSAVADWDDNTRWTRRMGEQGHAAPGVGAMLLASAATDLLDVNTWAALYTVGRYIANGKRDFKLPTWHIGPVEGTFPHLSYYRTSRSEVVSGVMVVNPPGPGSIALSGAGSLDGNVQYVGLDVHGIPLGDRVSVSPHVGLTVNHDSGKPTIGYSIGADVRLQISREVSVALSATYGRNDLLHNDIRGNANGDVPVFASIGLSI